MYETILYLIGNAFNIYLFMYALHLLFSECRVPQYVLWIYGTIYFAVNSAAYLIWDNPFINIADSLIFLYGISFFYKAKWQQYCFYPISIFIISGLTEGITALIPIINADIVGEYYIGISTIVKDFLFFFVVLYFRKTKKTDQPLPMQSWCMLFAVPLLSLTAVGTLAYRNTILPAQLIIVYVVLVAINILVFWLYNRLSAYYITQQQLQISQHQVELYSNQLSLQQQSEKQIRSIRHDLKGNIEHIHSLLLDNETDKALRYTESLSEEISATEKNHFTGNPVVDSVLNVKYAKAVKNNIPFEIRSQIPMELPFDEQDFCVILFNLLDNALEAQESVKSPFISVDIGMRAGLWRIQITNACKPNYILKRGELPKSTKKDRTMHGIGIQNMISRAEKYHGSCSFEAKNGVFTACVYLVEQNTLDFSLLSPPIQTSAK